MSWPGFHAPSAAWFFLLIPPLVILYFLKLKRPLLEVPSLSLWAQVMQDKRVNSPFQRWKRNILLWLQLLILCLLVLAAMLPYFRGAGASDRVLILLDRSASMGALDKVGGKTRLALAVERASEVIEGLAPGQEVGVIAFGGTASQIVSFTSSHRVLLDAIGKVTIEEVASDVVDALRMADAMARSTPFDRVLMFSDGNIPASVDFDLPFHLEFEKLPPGGANIGITGLRARRGGADGWSTFVRVQGSPGAEIPCSLRVMQDGEEIFNEAVHPGPAGGQRFVFPITATGTTQLEFSLQARGFDALAVDNKAWLTLREARPMRVLVPKSLGFFRHGMEVLEDVEIHETAVPEVIYDLVLANDPDDTPQAMTALHVGYIPSDLDSVVTVEQLAQGTDTVVDWRRNCALLEHVEMGELFLGERVSWRSAQQETALDSRRYEALAYGEKGPLIVQKEDGGLLRFHMLFDPARSTLPYRVGFPILCRNLLTIAMQRVGLLEVQGQRTGVLQPLQLLPDESYTVDGPGGNTQEKTDARGVLRGVPAARAGIYKVHRGGGEATVLGASLLAATETMLQGVDSLALNELTIEAAEERIATDQSLWSLLASIALVVLMVEWWFFQARPGGYVVRPA